MHKDGWGWDDERQQQQDKSCVRWSEIVDNDCSSSAAPDTAAVDQRTEDDTLAYNGDRGVCMARDV